MTWPCGERRDDCDRVARQSLREAGDLVRRRPVRGQGLAVELADLVLGRLPAPRAGGELMLQIRQGGLEDRPGRPRLPQASGLSRGGLVVRDQWAALNTWRDASRLASSASPAITAREDGGGLLPVRCVVGAAVVAGENRESGLQRRMMSSRMELPATLPRASWKRQFFSTGSDRPCPTASCRRPGWPGVRRSGPGRAGAQQLGIQALEGGAPRSFP
jgi:hypothetical protein